MIKKENNFDRWLKTTRADLTVLIQAADVKEQQEEPGKKYDAGKARFDLLPPDALFEVVQVFTRGAKIYGDHNWEKGMTWGRVFGAIQRHLWKFWRGETHDQDMGTHHLANAAWGCLVLMAYSMRKIGKDDRV